jgi:hypothetical protein
VVPRRRRSELCRFTNSQTVVSNVSTRMTLVSWSGDTSSVGIVAKVGNVEWCSAVQQMTEGSEAGDLAELAYRPKRQYVRYRSPLRSSH